jgi:hypothetical protein
MWTSAIQILVEFVVSVLVTVTMAILQHEDG